MSRIWASFTEYIVNNYRNSSKIVEVGVGRVLEPGRMLQTRMPDTTINLVDIHPANRDVIKDDITKATDSIYAGADLIYSIRPPEELQKSIVNLGIKYESDIIIKPLFTEEINYDLQSKLKLINYKRNAFYLYKRE